MSERLPVLFVSHGSPLFALNPGSTGPALNAWMQTHAPLEHLRAVVVMSPHWMSQGVAVMTQPYPSTWHDFGGFPPALYELQYPARGEPALAEQMLDLLHKAGISAVSDDQRPFDHGAWVPMRHILPSAPLVAAEPAVSGEDIETTDDELQAFMIVRAIAARHLPVERLTLRDS
jgi:4,5-DOPA dioxygenase extradiol